jgi:hypothetical protein
MFGIGQGRGKSFPKRYLKSSTARCRFFKDGLKDSTMDRRERYLKHGERRVHGWLDKFSARYISSLDAIQEVVGATGAVAIISPRSDCRSVEITALNLFGQPKELM